MANKETIMSLRGCHRRRSNLPILLVLLVVLFASCNTTEVKPDAKRIFPEYHYALDSIIKSNEGIVCGVELGQSRKFIIAEQQKNAVDKDKDGLVYEQKIDSLTKYNITYTFEKDTISEMEVMVNCSSRDEGDVILNDLKNFYGKKYTAPIMDKGFFVFNCFDSKKRNFTITLTDNGGTSNSVIDILIYREK